MTATGCWYALPEHIGLRRRKDYCLIINKHLNRVQLLHPAEALVLTLLDGRTSTAELAYIIGKIYGRAEGPSRSWVEKVLLELEPYLTRTAAPRFSPRHYDPMDFIFPGFEERPDGTSLLEAPVELALGLTRRCNFRCRYCVYGTGPQPDEDLNAEAALRVIAEAADLGVLSITLSGGEPTLHPDLVRVIEAVTRRKMECFVSTNGSRLDDRMAGALAQSGLHTIQVSIDSPFPDTHHFITQSHNTFDKVLAGIDRLKANGIRVRTRSVLTADNYDQAADLIDLLMAHGVGQIDLCVERFGTCESASINPSAGLSPARTARLQQQVKEGAGRYPNVPIRLIHGDADWTNAAQVVRCGSLTSVMIVHATGNVSVCEMLRESPEMSYGNIHHASLKQIWAGPAQRRILSAATDRAGVDPQCAQCNRLDYCATGCFNSSKRQHGRFFMKDARCPGPQVINRTLI